MKFFVQDKEDQNISQHPLVFLVLEEQRDRILDKNHTNNMQKKPKTEFGAQRYFTTVPGLSGVRRSRPRISFRISHVLLVDSPTGLALIPTLPAQTLRPCKSETSSTPGRPILRVSGA